MLKLEVNYQPGTWTALVAGSRVAVLPEDFDATRQSEIWKELKAGAELSKLVNILVQEGLSGLPTFGLFEFMEHPQALVRGNIEIITEEQTYSGQEVATWLEVDLSHAENIAVCLQNPSGPNQGDYYEISAGIVKISALQVQVPTTETRKVFDLTEIPELEPDQDPENEADVISVLGYAPSVVNRTEDTPITPISGQRTLSEKMVQLKGEQVFSSTVPRPDLNHLTEDPLFQELYLEEVESGAPELTTALLNEIHKSVQHLTGEGGEAFDHTEIQRIRFSHGPLVPVDREVIIGRAPGGPRVTTNDLPRLVTVPSPSQDISRTHAQVKVSGGVAYVTDLNSTNGVYLRPSDDEVIRINPGEPTPFGYGIIVDLGDGITFSLEEN